MSAVNYYVIIKSGVCYVPIMYFASVHPERPVCGQDCPADEDSYWSAPRFMKLVDAIEFAENEHTEYG